MENKIMMPANYLAMSEEEMTYTDGGWFLIDDVAAIIWGYQIGQYAKKNPTATFAQVVDGALAEPKRNWGNALVALICVADFYDTIFGAAVGLIA